MNVRRYYWLIAAVFVVLAVLGFSVANSVQRTVGLQEKVSRDIRYAMWTTSQAVVELDRFRYFATRYVLGDGDVSHERVTDQFDVFWSRIPVLLNGSETTAIRNIPEMPENLRNILVALKAADPEVAALKPGDIEALRSLLALFEPAERFLRSLSVEVHVGKVWREAYTEKMTRSTWMELEMSVLGTIFCIVILIALLAWEARRSRMLLRSVETSRRALRDSELQYRLITNNLPVSISYIDTDERFQFVNDTCASWFALCADGIRGRKVEAVHVASEYEKFRTRIENALTEGRLVEFEETAAYPDGVTRDISGIYVPHKSDDDAVVGVFVMIQDVTERKQLEVQLRRSQKMEALGQVTGGVAHEFNNLLMAIIGNLELLLERDLRDMGSARERVEKVLNSAFRGKDLTGRLLSYTGNAFDRPEIVDAGDVVARVAEFLRPALGETIVVETEVADSLWPIEVDPSEFENALANLAINARDAMTGGGAITIAVANARLDESFSNSRPYRVKPGDYVGVSVCDTGAGMSPEIVSRAFDPFYTTKDVGAGTGLGLSMVYGFVHRRSGGYVDIESAESRGTKVTMYFPRAERATEEQADTAAPMSPAANRRVVLLVEDDADVREMLAGMLEAAGCTVIPAVDGNAALAALEPAGKIDLLLTDVVLPGGMNGVALADRVRVVRPDTKTVLISGYAEAERMTKGDIEHRYPLLSKPFQKDDLLELLAETFAPDENVEP